MLVSSRHHDIEKGAHFLELEIEEILLNMNDFLST